MAQWLRHLSDVDERRHVLLARQGGGAGIRLQQRRVIPPLDGVQFVAAGSIRLTAKAGQQVG